MSRERWQVWGTLAGLGNVGRSRERSQVYRERWQVQGTFAGLGDVRRSIGNVGRSVDTHLVDVFSVAYTPWPRHGLSLATCCNVMLVMLCTVPIIVAPVCEAY